MKRLEINCRDDWYAEDVGSVDAARSFGAAITHTWVRELAIRGGIRWVDPAALEALADALLSRTCGVEKVELGSLGVGLSPAYLPALARLLAGRDDATLAAVHMIWGTTLFENATDADIELVCAALRRTTLTHMVLHHVGLTEQNEASLRQAAAAAPRLRLELLR